LPNTSSELAILAGTQTFTGNKTFPGTLTASGTVTVSAASARIGTATTTATYRMGTGATTTGVAKTVNRHRRRVRIDQGRRHRVRHGRCWRDDRHQPADRHLRQPAQTG
jgi:hypothetical protein